MHRHMTTNIFYTNQDRTAAVAKAEQLIGQLFPENDATQTAKNHKRLMAMGGDMMTTTIFCLENTLKKEAQKKEAVAQAAIVSTLVI